MADNDFPTLVSKDTNPNIVTNPLFVKLTDGSAALGTVGDALKVSVVNSSIAVTGTFWQATQPVSGTFWQVTQPVSGSVTVSATALDIRTITKASDSIQISKDTNANASGNPIFVDVSAQTLTAIKVSATAAANSASNPIYVALGSGPITGEVHDYDTATVSGGSPDNHDYTVVTAMLVKSIIVASSGALRAELLTGPVGTLVSKAVLFIPKQGGSQQVDFDPPIEVPTTSTGTVRIIRTNREGTSNDVYSTIIGIDA